MIVYLCQYGCLIIWQSVTAKNSQNIPSLNHKGIMNVPAHSTWTEPGPKHAVNTIHHSTYRELIFMLTPIGILAPFVYVWQNLKISRLQAVNIISQLSFKISRDRFNNQPFIQSNKIDTKKRKCLFTVCGIRNIFLRTWMHGVFALFSTFLFMFSYT